MNVYVCMVRNDERSSPRLGLRSVRLPNFYPILPQKQLKNPILLPKFGLVKIHSLLLSKIV